MGIKVVARNNKFPQNLNRQIQHKTIRVKMEQRNVKKVDNIHVTFTNKENHQRIQTHKHRHGLQEHKHITTTHKIQNTVTNNRILYKKSLENYMYYCHISYMEQASLA